MLCGLTSVCSSVTQHMKALLERNTKKKSKLRKKPKPYVEEPDGRASPAAPGAALHSSALPRSAACFSPPLTTSGLGRGGTNCQASSRGDSSLLVNRASWRGRTTLSLASEVLRTLSGMHAGRTVWRGLLEAALVRECSGGPSRASVPSLLPQHSSLPLSVSALAQNPIPTQAPGKPC